MHEPSPHIILMVVFAAAGITMFCTYLRQKRKLCAVFFGTGSGIAALWFCSRYGNAMPLNVCNLMIAAVGGVPAVLLLRVLTYFTK